MKITLSAAIVATLALSGVAQADVSKNIGRASQIKGGTSDITPAASHQMGWLPPPSTASRCAKNVV